ncbi:MAG: flagellar basal-body rod protein FlgG [bacterium]|nr:flagellar basal-body rod protein FlgG [bacterium]
MRALFVAATGMQSQQLNIDNIANNLANVNTTGFKRGRVDFQDLLYQAIRPVGANATVNTEVPTGIYLGYGSRPAAIEKNFTQGAYQQTGQPYDVLIEGDGFFQVTLPNGDTAYTRDGAFKLNNQGQVVTSNGDLLTPNITVPSDALTTTIGTDGTVTVTQAGQSAPSVIGNITIARFANPAGLEAMGQNLFRETQASGAPTTGTPGAEGYGTLRQSMLENSNVSVVEELVNMIVSQRAYEINSKAITTADEMMQTASQLKR